MNDRLRSHVFSLALGGAVALAGAGLVWAVHSLPATADGLAMRVEGNLAPVGVKNRITAVLLSFRGYDTMFEVAVLVLAWLGVQAVCRHDAALPQSHEVSAAGPVLEVLVHVLGPLLVLVSGYLLWAGADAPGGAFQAGALLAGLGVLLLLAHGHHPRWPAWAERLVVIAGVTVFLAVSVAGMVLTGYWLGFPPAWSKTMILIIEAAATLSIGIILALLYAGHTLSAKAEEDPP